MSQITKKLTTATWGSTSRKFTDTTAWLRPTLVLATRTGATTSSAPKPFAVVTGTTPTTNQVEFTAPSTFVFGTGLSATTTNTTVSVLGATRGQGASVA